jgi:hypothetical protein
MKKVPLETKPTAQSSTSVNPADFTNHSGGALGSDTEWDVIGKNFGMVNNKHYYTGVKGPGNAPLGNVDITDQAIAVEGASKVAQAAKEMWGYKYDTMKDQRLIRNWAQVANSDAVFAVGTLGKEGDIWKGDEKSSEPRRLLKPAVQGGTGYAVEMAIQAGKPVYVFDQIRNQWYKNINGQWSKSEVPVLTKNFAGIGTREINEAGKQAIRNVYANTFKTTQPTQPSETLKENLPAVEPPSLKEQLSTLEAERKELLEIQKESAPYIPELIIADNLPKIQTESAKKETGLNVGTKQDINPSLISTDGMTVEKAAEYLQQDYFNGVQYQKMDLQDIRNAIIEILSMGKAAFVQTNTPLTSELEDVNQEIASVKAKIEVEAKSEELDPNKGGIPVDTLTRQLSIDFNSFESQSSDPEIDKKIIDEANNLPNDESACNRE